MAVKFIQYKDGAVIQGGSLEELQEFWKKFVKDFPDHCYKFSNYGVSEDGIHIATYYVDYYKRDNG